VGDAEFQKKCLGKMNDVAKGEGRTVLFVSHNMAAVKSLCNKGILLENGGIKENNLIKETLEVYNNSNINCSLIEPNFEKKVYLIDFYANSKLNNFVFVYEENTFHFKIQSNIEIDNVYIGFGINDELNNRIFTPFSMHFNKKYKLIEGENSIKCMIDKFPLKPGIYQVEIYIGDGYNIYDYYNKPLNIEVVGSDKLPFSRIPNESQGSLIYNQIWN
jgi:lipopolysaccharide transport system ATP-binding protein